MFFRLDFSAAGTSGLGRKDAIDLSGDDNDNDDDNVSGLTWPWILLPSLLLLALHQASVMALPLLSSAHTRGQGNHPAAVGCCS